MLLFESLNIKIHIIGSRSFHARLIHTTEATLSHRHGGKMSQLPSGDPNLEFTGHRGGDHRRNQLGNADIHVSLVREDDHGRVETKQARLATPDETFYAERGKQYFLQAIPTLNDVLGKLLTLATALAGGGLVIGNGTVISKPVGVVVVFLFIISIVFSLVGLWPNFREMDKFSTDEIRNFTRHLIQRKRLMLSLAGICIVTGLVIALIGMIFNGK
ncbi:MAG: hypothetical protein U0798_14320 [Gemmataceae bacterium]